MPTKDFNIISSGATGEPCSTMTDCGIYLDGTAIWSSPIGSYTVSYTNAPKDKRTRGIHPLLFFKYVKKKFGTIEGYRMNKRIKNLEKAFYAAIENGQEVLAEKFLTEFSREFRESAIYAKGIKMFIEREDLNRHKHNIRDGHISDTKYSDFTRVIPKSIIAKKKKLEGIFDDFVIYHYWNEEVEKKIAKKQRMSDDERRKMEDPILFGTIKESNRLYVIGEWIDSECDLSFEEIASVVGKTDDEITLTDKPKMRLTKSQDSSTIEE